MTQAENIILLESYMDLEKLYGDTLNNINPDELKYAYNMVQTNKEIKNLVKKNLNLGLGGLEKAIVTKYPSPVDFINSVFQAKDNLEKNKVVQNQKNQDQLKRQNELKENETEDFYIIPCRTFEQAHKAAFSHTGNLLLMSNQKIKETYHINVPEPANFYRTDKTPAEMLEFMKQAPFFMNPTWCIAANENYWYHYNLDSDEGEPCMCYIIISKQHPNVRFCITKRQDTEFKINDKLAKNILFDYDIATLEEFRDPWQAGAQDVVSYGEEMFNSIKQINTNTRNKINEIIKKVDMKTSPTAIYLNKLKDGIGLFTNMTFSSVNVNFKNLYDGSMMFCGCKNLSEFISKTPNLKNGDYMFADCNNLTKFNSDLSILNRADKMFYNCQLDEKSILNILNSIPIFEPDKYTDEYNVLDIGRNINFKESKTIATLLKTTSPIKAGDYHYKNWVIRISDKIGKPIN